MLKNVRFVRTERGFIMRLYPLQKTFSVRLCLHFRLRFRFVPDGADEWHWFWLWFGGWVAPCADLRSDRP